MDRSDTESDLSPEQVRTMVVVSAVVYFAIYVAVAAYISMIAWDLFIVSATIGMGVVTTPMMCYTLHKSLHEIDGVG